MGVKVTSTKQKSAPKGRAWKKTDRGTRVLVKTCLVCGRELNNPDDMPDSVDCGGDCRFCMARFGDPDERRAMGWTDPDYEDDDDDDYPF